MIKLTCILLLLVGCVHTEELGRDAKRFQCIKELIGKHGVEAEKAGKVCGGIYEQK